MKVRAIEDEAGDRRRVAGRMADCLRLVSAWTGALQGQGDLENALNAMVALLPIRRATLLRVSADGGQSRVVALALRKGDAGPIARIRDLPALIAAARMGEVTPHSAGGAVLLLTRARTHADILDLRYETAPAPAHKQVLEPLGKALADAWSHRRPGLIARRIVEQTRRNRPAALADRPPILDYTNPYALSRSEFRVCALIGQGLNARQIAAELGLSEATVRSHQRSIYAKTDLRGQIEVLYHLQAQAVPCPILPGRPAQSLH